MVHLCKPAHYREVAFTDKTGGCNNEASAVERMSVYVPVRVRQADREVTGGADSHCKTNLLIGMRKGSVYCSRGRSQERVCSMSG
jgi:hypothetical protein